jgi:glutaredoxin 3
VKLVTVYTTDPCARCLKAKMLLKHRGIAYQEINLAKDPDGRAELVRRTGMLTFPQVVVGEHTVGGLEDLLSADKSGLLAELTNAPA